MEPSEKMPAAPSVTDHGGQRRGRKEFVLKTTDELEAFQRTEELDFIRSDPVMDVAATQLNAIRGFFRATSGKMPLSEGALRQLPESCIDFGTRSTAHSADASHRRSRREFGQNSLSGIFHIKRRTAYQGRPLPCRSDFHTKKLQFPESARPFIHFFSNLILLASTTYPAGKNRLSHDRRLPELSTIPCRQRKQIRSIDILPDEKNSFTSRVSPERNASSDKPQGCT